MLGIVASNRRRNVVTITAPAFSIFNGSIYASSATGVVGAPQFQMTIPADAGEGDLLWEAVDTNNPPDPASPNYQAQVRIILSTGPGSTAFSLGDVATDAPSDFDTSALGPGPTYYLQRWFERPLFDHSILSPKSNVVTLSLAPHNSTAYRYYRLYVTANQSGGNVTTLAKMALAVTSGGADTTGGQTYTASDSETSLESDGPSNAFDSNASTFWGTQVSGGAVAPPHWLKVDYGATSANWKAINEMKLTARADNGNQAPATFKLQGSTDNFGSSIVDLITVSGLSDWTDGLTKTFEV